ncbi:hypothetical protein CFC21_014559 [Triticum aestivum]|uniref:Protein kinase domain-containing protein n=2 Tax=Triticum aestivum TaxID=4565 RepID=A0A9R1DUK7_WHEAT|nr:hypothetical protein CFC21_014559 [Triticum aestivum]
MALLTGLGQAATVAQLVGVDIGGLISMIVQAARMARQNRSECEQLARRVLMIAQLLPHVQEPEAVQPLAELGDTLREAHELVVSCQGRNAAYQLVMAGRQAERFRDVHSRIDSYLILFPVISHIGMTRRLGRIYNVLVPEDSSRVDPSPLPQPQESTEVAQEVLPHGTQQFTWAEIVAATNNFDTVIARGSSGMVYKGRLDDGREVAIKHIKNDEYWREDFSTELHILSRLQHKHIIRLLGSCVIVSKDKCPLTTRQKIKKGLLTRWRKEPEEPEEPERLIIVYEYMENGTLHDLLGSDQGSSMLSPVTVSWKLRMDVLLGVSRAIEYLHCHAHPPIIHRDINSSNIVFDASWVPRVADFGSSVASDVTREEEGVECEAVGTLGYVDPEYHDTFLPKPAADVYSLGVVMFEVLTGKRAVFIEEKGTVTHLPNFAITLIEAGNLGEMLDRRPSPEPTPWELQALKHVARTARHCVKLSSKDRPTISDIVGKLEMAYELTCRDESGSVDELPDSPRGSNVSSAGCQSDLEPEALEDGP